MRRRGRWISEDIKEAIKKINAYRLDAFFIALSEIVKRTKKDG